MTATRPAPGSAPADITAAAAESPDAVLAALDVDDRMGLSAAEAARRLTHYGANVVSSHRTRVWAVLWRQVRSPLLALLVTAAVISFFVGEHSDAVIIGVIVALSVGLGFGNEYRAERAAEALHDAVKRQATVWRDGAAIRLEVAALVPGDVADLHLGDIVPADMRLLSVAALECDESVLTGESLPVAKDAAPVPPDTPLADLRSCALMGTVVHAGTGRGVVIGTGAATEFGKIAAGISTHHLETEFQIGLRKFSMLLVWVAGSLTTSIFIANVVLHRPVIDALLFSLAIAVGITPQLLPAVVSTSLAAGSRQMRRRKVLVKRLVCIEDLGDVETLFTDKTGTLTIGQISYMRAVPAADSPDSDPARVLRWGLLCTEAATPEEAMAGGNALDQALWRSPAASAHRDEVAPFQHRQLLPFDHDRRLASVLVADPAGSLTVVT
jgi:Mg2+-importing ATPase